MATKLRYVDPTHQPGVVARAYAALAATRLSRFVSRHVSWKLDPLLLRATRGRLATTFMFPTAVLETTGAKSGARHPDVIFGGIAMHATVVEDEADRSRLWQLADRVFPAFASYRRDAAKVNRCIPIVQLTPR